MKFIILLCSLIVIACNLQPSEKIIEIPAQEFPEPDKDPNEPVPSGPNFIDLQNLEFTMFLDVSQLESPAERENTRYLIGCDRFNQNHDLTFFEQGVNKGINMLSNQRFVRRATPIGTADCIYRIDLRDYGITTREWRLVEQNVQLEFVSQTVTNQNLQFLVQARKPYLFAVDFFLTSFEADSVANKGCAIYCDLIDQEFILDDFYQQNGVLLQREYDDQRVLLSGFSQSQIALGKTRLVEVVESRNGYILSTYDVSLAEQDNIFLNPFTKEASLAGGINRTKKTFRHVAQEHIYSLVNGLWGFRLNGANGNAESFAPNDVVINLQAASAQLEPTIYLGSCSGCHHQNVGIEFSDQVNQHVNSNPSFNAQEKLLADIFYDYDAIDAVINEINRINRQQLSELGITSGDDPINKTLFEPFRKEMNARQIAAFTFLTEQEFLERLRGASVSSTLLGNLLNGGTVSIQDIKDAFPILVEELNLFRDEDL